MGEVIGFPVAPVRNMLIRCEQPIPTFDIFLLRGGLYIPLVGWFIVLPLAPSTTLHIMSTVKGRNAYTKVDAAEKIDSITKKVASPFSHFLLLLLFRFGFVLFFFDPILVTLIISDGESSRAKV
jgi:hypothetical protein